MFKISSFPVFQQLDQMDCGPACLKIIAKHYNKNIGLDTLREYSSLTSGGSSMAGLNEAAEKIGFDCTGAKVSLKQLKENVPLPVIAHWDQKHFVVIYQITSKRVHISDPAIGLRSYSYKKFLHHWGIENNGIILMLSPRPGSKFENNHKLSHQRFGFIYEYIRPHKFLIGQLFLSLFLAMIIQVLLPFLTQSLVDYGINYEDFGFLYLIVIAQIFLTLTRTVTQIIREAILIHLSIRVSVSMISDFIDKLLKLPLIYFGSKSIGDFTQRIYDHSRIEDFISNSAFSIFFDVFSIVVLATILAYFNVSIFIVFALGSLLFIGWSMIFLKRKAFIDHELFNLNRLDHSLIIQMISSVREIKLNGSFLRRKRDWKNVQAQLFNTQMKMLRVDQSQINGGLFLKELTGVLIIFISAKAVVDGHMTLGTMLAIQFIIGSLSVPISNIVHFVVEFQKANLSFKRLAEIHTQPVEKNIKRKIYNFEQGSIDIENVQFGYAEKAISPILHNLSFSIPLKKTTALVGGSGAGKSTILKLLLKLYEPQKGQIRINDENLKNINTDYWRSLCGVVLQDGILFNDTIERNITESLSQLPTDYNSLNQALIISNLHEFVESLPLGVQTKVGENGSFLSGGQKQRMMIARAIYKNPEFLFFDEATSSLDAENEKMITENLISLQKNKTLLVIAHRLSTVKNADQILVMENGQIIESGTHVELLNNRGYYHQLIHNQLN